MSKLHDKESTSYWGGLALAVLQSDKALCGLSFILVLATLSILTLHLYGIDVLPHANAAAHEVTRATLTP